MAGVQHETRLGAQSVVDLVEEIGGQIDRRSTCIANAVKVVICGEMVGRGLMAPMDVGDDACRLQKVEGAVHRREVDLGMIGVDSVGQSLRRQMLIACIDDGIENLMARPGDAVTAGPEDLEKCRDGVLPGRL